jgi:predicted nucleotidyltransferase
MKSSKQIKVASQMVEKYSKKASVIAISLFGSVAEGRETPISDLDIEIIDEEAEKFSYETKQIGGVYVDLVILPKKSIQKRLKDYPYLNYGYINRKILYDPSGFMQKIKEEASLYFSKHPEIVKFWEEKLEYVKRMKAEGKKPESAFKTYDEAEILFSKEHKITRDFFISNE